jgi:hypothetical protein
MTMKKLIGIEGFGGGRNYSWASGVKFVCVFVVLFCGHWDRWREFLLWILPITKRVFFLFFGGGGGLEEIRTVYKRSAKRRYLLVSLWSFWFCVCGLFRFEFHECERVAKSWREREREREREITFLWRLGVEYDQKPGLAQHATTRLRSSWSW